ncbi:proline-specific peptidase [Calocera cornea HHB12733]|uniref:Proline-specific peptidase n=1 Tax=Calocera cornea HHB12733 TaxID=1353952 RepID=A0A165GJS7_9BASI|nr:proline-specific peptidase [Calocera cornea HHB12733]
MATSSGNIPFRDTYETWYQIYGDLATAKHPPLIFLHGGPGVPGRYLLTIGDLWNTHGIPVIFYDQLGCGNSTHLPDKGPEFWTVGLFLDELDNLLVKLGIKDSYFLGGNSWGGMLAAEHGVLRPKGLKKLVIADSPASMELWLEAAEILLSQLPPDVRRAIEENEKNGTTDTKEYKDACVVFYAQHVCRIQPYPADVTKSFELLDEDPTVYYTMNGPSEFSVVGTLKTWSIIDRVAAIEVPTLLINGKFDEAMDLVVQPYADKIKGAKWVTFPNSSHMPHHEERAEYMKVVGGFLTE